MKRLTTEWIEKAEEDHLVALELGSSLKLTPYNVICFHCQQAGEKWLKSRLCEEGIHLPKTHDLSSLLHQLMPLYPDWISLMRAAENPSSYAINMRYPRDSAPREDMEQALLDMCAIRDQVRASFGIQ